MVGSITNCSSSVGLVDRVAIYIVSGTLGGNALSRASQLRSMSMLCKRLSRRIMAFVVYRRYSSTSYSSISQSSTRLPCQ